jgi:hypothetical protein
LDGHDSHVTIEAIDQAREFGLDMIALPSHTSHDLETLNVFCFKPKLKQHDKKERDATMVRNN